MFSVHNTFYVFFLFAFLNFVSTNEKRETRLAGGQLAEPGQFPYTVLVIHLRHTVLFSEIYPHRRCGGAIIGKRWVVTAATCTQGINSVPEYVRVQVGATNLLTDGDIHSIESIINHPKYNQTVYRNDISLLYLVHALEWSETVQPIPLENRFIGDGVRVLACGWGYTQVCLHFHTSHVSLWWQYLFFVCRIMQHIHHLI